MVKAEDIVTAPLKVTLVFALVKFTVGTITVPVNVDVLQLVIVKILALVLPPTEIVPAVPVLIDKERVPDWLILLEALKFAPVATVPPFVVSMTTFPLKVTGPFKEMVLPLLVIFPKRLIAVAPV